jgi:hypothetical protein
VEEIRGHKIKRTKLWLLVKWEGWERKKDITWESESNIRSVDSAGPQ